MYLSPPSLRFYLSIMVEVLNVVSITAVFILNQSLAVRHIEYSKRLSYNLIDHIIVATILSGTVPCGGRLPPVREMAAEAGVNPNTMQRALAQLEAEGLVYSQRTAGRFVTEDGAMIDGAKRELARRHVRAFLEAMRGLGLEEEAVIGLLRQAYGKEQEGNECPDL